jgi:hypothetical protein
MQDSLLLNKLEMMPLLCDALPICLVYFKGLQIGFVENKNSLMRSSSYFKVKIAAGK